MTWLGVIASFLVALASLDFIAGFVVFCLFMMTGLTWVRGIIPVVPMALAYQWVFGTTGYLFFLFSDRWPGGDTMGDVEAAVLLSSVGLLAFAVGISWVLVRLPVNHWASVERYSPQKLFWLTIGAFLVGWIFDIGISSQLGGLSQPVGKLLEARFVLVFMLISTVIAQRQGWSYLVTSLGVVIGPSLLTGFSRFKEPIFVVAAAIAAEWQPASRDTAQKRINKRIIVSIVIAALGIAALGLVWNGSIKAQWREYLWQNGIGGSQIEKLEVFADVVISAPSDFDVARAWEATAGRLSSGLNYFSHVVARVPQHIDHEGGALIGRAIYHVTTPRFLFPNKENLGGDSWLVRQYAGLNVAGNESGASIGLGYIAEFYIDFGVAGVIFAAFLYGLLAGGMAYFLAVFSPDVRVFGAVLTTLFVSSFMVYDASFTKALGGQLQFTIILLVLLVGLGSWLRRAAIRG
ncbi:hypothetical protein BN1012_Phect875 [Candidatus Phaeomarinobacter ectocarpi]|uniref:Uncharacterized protein n=1 Tax=Candidatus Phaeomarinibacter ectocarpi TaxID=1458461 RepID=X5ME76_9HYPH|nr:hypothetical protein [Candidatus Phaeomarinobacter ectocarpi]CDO59089.1 hypothetical protein BN1012_Phect875 [Candidatus Phaeomarinobacter ectocarpi]